MKNFILWDNDGVLVDTEYWYFKATQRALAELGVELTRDNYMQVMIHGRTSWDLARQAGVPDEQVLAKQNERDAYYREYLRSKDIEIPGVIETLQHLSQNCRMAIVTTSKGVDFELIHRDREILPFMDFVLTREDYRKSKPDPEPYLTALQRFGIGPEQALVVEDSQRGLGAAMAAGIDCAIVHNEFTASHDFSGASFIIDAITELPDKLGL